MDSFADVFRLTGKVALVTGASKGIGRSMAHLLAAAGAKVVVSSRKLESVEAVAEEIRSAGGEAAAMAAHVGDLAACHKLVDDTVARYGGIDVLINNAASNPTFGPVVNTDETVFDKILAVNVKGPLELAKQAYPSFCQRGGGSVINISSIGGIKPEPMLGLYSVSKAALISLTKVLAAEWGHDKIRVNVICPGLVKTKFSAALWQNEQIYKHFLEKLPLSRMAEPDEIAPLALYLASPASGYCTGGVYTIDGGCTI